MRRGNDWDFFAGFNIFKIDIVSVQGFLQTSVGEEKKYNPRLTKSLEEFVYIMKNLKLSYPKQIGSLHLTLLVRLRLTCSHSKQVDVYAGS